MHVQDVFGTLTNDELKLAARELQLPFAVAIPNFSSMDPNTGTIIRTACAFGASHVFMFGKRKYDRRTSIGTHHYVDILSYCQENVEAEFDWSYLLQTVRLHNYTPVIIELGEGSLPLDELQVSTDEPVCLVIGSELFSVPTDICKTEQWYSIPQPGIGRSLNTATAASIAMYHVMQQHLHTT